MLRVTPTPRLVLLFVPALVLCLMADLDLFGQGFSALAPPLCAALLAAGVALLDFPRKSHRPAITVRRQVPKSLPLNVWSSFTITLANAGPGVFSARIADRWPGDMELDPEEIHLALAPRKTVSITCRVQPNQRGVYNLSGLDALADSPWRLWRESRHLPCAETVRVFPNFRELKRYALLARADQLGQMGIRERARRSDGQEFLQLREYEPGDALRQIDWKATSRFQRLISREYQEEHDQHIVLALDCSRRMRHREAGLSQFDQALNSALLLAHVAARQGDSVGLLACGERLVWHAPGKKAGATRSLLLASTEIFPDATAVDYRELARELDTRLKRRSLVILLTNSRAEEHGELAVLARQVGRRHLLVVADLVEQEVADAFHKPAADLDSALRYQALLSHRHERRRFALQLRRLGCISLTLTAKELPPALVNTYLDIKYKRQV